MKVRRALRRNIGCFARQAKAQAHGCARFCTRKVAMRQSCIKPQVRWKPFQRTAADERTPPPPYRLGSPHFVAALPDAFAGAAVAAAMAAFTSATVFSATASFDCASASERSSEAFADETLASCARVSSSDV